MGKQEESTEATTEITTLNQQDFSIMDKEDENQIINADAALKQALVYKVKDRMELSYVGLKHLTLLMSQTGQSLEIIDCKMELLGDKPEEKVWYATVKVRNRLTLHETIGMSESPYMIRDKIYENGVWTNKYGSYYYDQFGRTKTLSKAERNAWRKQIPEFEIKKLLEDAQTKGQVKELTKNCDCGAGKRDIDPNTKICRKCGGKSS